jgi:hypothetical protein
MSTLQKPSTPEAQALGRRGGRATKRPFKFSISDVAAAAGKSVVAVQKDRQRGKFNPHDLPSLWQYLYNCSERGQ